MEVFEDSEGISEMQSLLCALGVERGVGGRVGGCGEGLVKIC